MHVETEFEESWKEWLKFLGFKEVLLVRNLWKLPKLCFEYLKHAFIPTKHNLSIFLQKLLKKHFYSWLICMQLARYNF